MNTKQCPDIEKLKELAHAATKLCRAPWKACDIDNPSYPVSIRDADDLEIVTMNDWNDDDRNMDCAAYIAAANPASVMSIVNRMEEAENDRNALLDEVLEYRGIRDRLARRDQAGNLPEDASIYIGLLENRLAENRAKLALMAADAQAMQNKLRLCVEAMQANDPGNYAAIFGADEQATA